MRIATLLVLVAVAAPASACPWWGRSCPPRPVVVYRYYCPPPVVHVVEAKPVEPVKDPDAAPDGWCHIRGRIVYAGSPLPVQKLIPKSGGAYTEEWVVNHTNRGVKNVVVWLIPELSSEQLEDLRARRLREVPNFKPEQVYPQLSRKGKYSLVHGDPVRAYYPHVQAAQAGSDLTIRSLSAVPDNPKWSSLKNGEFSPLLPPGQQRTIEDLKSERLPIAIENSIYPWMRAYVWVLDHPYCAVTDEDGAFEIKFAPKGNLRLVIWQEQMGWRNGREGRWGEPIRVPSGRLDLGDIALKPIP